MQSNLKNIAVICPILPQPLENEFIKSGLGFLNCKYNLSYFDPLADINSQTNESFKQYWRDKIISMLNEYEVFIGFSLGGIILQECLDLISATNKKIILFSTPSFIDEAIKHRLEKVVNLLKNNLINDAVNKLNEYVFFPESNVRSNQIYQFEYSGKRMLFGLQYVLQADSRMNLQQNDTDFLHFIGGKSKLVNKSNVVVSQHCKLISIPEAGMRMLQTHQALCMNYTNEFLGS